MMFRRKPWTAASLLVLVMNILRGYTLTCHPSEYQIENECCPMCLPGFRVKTDCTEFRSTSCLPCSEGTFTSQLNGHKKCFPCTNCDAGSGLKTNTSCTIISDTVCEPLEGFYCMDSTEDGCMAARKHTSCQAGQYISRKGTASRDTVCSDCSDGEYSNGTFTSCQPHTQCESMDLQLITPGNVSTDAECGEKTNKTIKIGIGTVIVLNLLIGAVFLLFYLKKKKGSTNKERKRDAENPKSDHLNGEGAEMMKGTINHI